MRISEYHFGFIGFGHMAQIIFEGIDHAKLIPRQQISFVQQTPQKMIQSEKKYGITSTSLGTLLRTCDIVLLCVRPSQAEIVFKAMADLEMKAKMFITVLAGKKLSFYEKYLPPETQILRVMPNICSSVGEGMSIFSYSKNATTEFRSLSNILFSCMGQVIEIEEKHMDIACGIAGSGPGFVVKLIDAAAKIGEKAGLDYKKALQMAAQTFLGAGKLILKGANPSDLVTQIATPNGVTEAGFRKMHEKGLDKGFQEVIEASAARSQELG